MLSRFLAFALTLAVGVGTASLFESKQAQRNSLLRIDENSLNNLGPLGWRKIQLPRGCYQHQPLEGNSLDIRPMVYCDHKLTMLEQQQVKTTMEAIHGPGFRFDLVMPTFTQYSLAMVDD